jgi:hypothetical protein
MAVLTVSDMVAAGLDITAAAMVAPAAGGDVLPNGDGNSFLVVNNAGASNMTVTVTAQRTSIQREGFPTVTVPDITVTVPAAKYKLVGPFGRQKGVVITESVATIDTSSKEKSEETHLPGRYSATLTLDTLYVEGAASFRELQYRLRNGVQVRLRTSTLGVNDEVALATVTGITKTAADQQAVTANASFKLSGPWEAAE